MKRIAVFPGSFDPITLGHEAIIRRALPMFDQIIVGLGQNQNKEGYFPVERRINWIKKVFQNERRIETIGFEGLTVDFCRKMDAGYILRGLRSETDFAFEEGIGQMNRAMMPEIETIFMLTNPEYSAISSSILRDIHRNKGDIRPFIPIAIRSDF
jgi:pantetheine-phosphate adenylyltransferase